jgi:hypothetical protein
MRTSPQTRPVVRSAPRSWLGRAEIARFRYPYLVLADGEVIERTFDPMEAFKGARQLSVGRPAGHTAMLRVGDASTLRWFQGGAEVEAPGVDRATSNVTTG